MDLRSNPFTARGAAAVAAIVAALVSPAAAQMPPSNVPVMVENPSPTTETAPPAIPELGPGVQVVRFLAPEGTKVEILGPAPEPILAGMEKAPNALTVGLRVGVGYRLKLSNLPNVAEGSELFPVVELVGHLHRVPGIDPYKYPVRIALDEEDFEDAAARGRLVTKVVYLEAPEQAIPVSVSKDRTPALTLSPAEDPIKVAPALGRVMAIVRVGGRAPTPQELSGQPEWSMGSAPCPFAAAEGGRCPIPCGPMPRQAEVPGRPGMPRDEFLCDGGDHGEPAHFGGDGSLAGVGPKDAVLKFQADGRSRILPTNTVCLYAPRFAAVRSALGPNQAFSVEYLREGVGLNRQATHQARQAAKKFTAQQSAEMARVRTRASGFKGRVNAVDHIELRILRGYDVTTNIAGHVKVQNPETAKNRQNLAVSRTKVKVGGLKTAETAVVTGLAEGLGEKVMAWRPQEVAAVEVPPNKPGLAVVKQVSAAEAEPGDVVTFTIRYRNMGNVPIVSVSVVDSLLPRLEYVARSAMGQEGTVFAAGENTAGSVELRWDLPGAIAPGAEGYVQFQARVR